MKGPEDMGAISRSQNGQTLIETALILVLLLAILIGIAMFAQAWYIKNSIKNAVRHGARVAVVTSGVTDLSDETCGNPCPAPNPPAGSADIIDAVCCSAGVPNNAATTTVSLNVVDDNGISGLNTGDTITVSATFSKADFFIVGGSPWPWPKGLDYTVEASMRYE